MSNAVVVHLGRRNTITVSLGIDVSNDTVTSQIRAQPDTESTLIATWVVTHKTDGTDGELILTLDDNFTSQIVAAGGFMDILLESGGEPLPVFDKPLEVEFQGTVTK